MGLLSIGMRLPREDCHEHVNDKPEPAAQRASDEHQRIRKKRRHAATLRR
jgi:hypothetical protein